MSPASGPWVGHRYQLAERIGTGGFSEVWRAADSVLGRPVAVKLLHVGYAQHAETLTRFRAEARHAGRLSHENIARVYDYGDGDPPVPPFLVMELVDGRSLAEVLADGPLGLARSIDILAQTAAGLDAAHQAGLVHRDIKPGNLMLAPDGVVKITDFGISHAADSAPVTATGMLVGTPGYLAPERVDGASATTASDLYALGIVAYECLSGGPPFTGSAIQVAMAHRDRPLPLLPAFVPADVAALVSELTGKDPVSRPGSAGEVARRAREMADRLSADGLSAARLSADGLSADGLSAARLSADPTSDGAAALTTHPGHHVPSAAPTGRQQPSLGLMGALAPEPRRWERWPGRRAALAVAGAVAAVAGLIMASMIDPAPPPRPPAVSSSSSPARSATVLMVEVNGGSLVGLPVSVAVGRLRRQGMKTRVLWQRSGQRHAGLVVAVRPAGRQPLGSLITVSGALAPASTLARPSGQARSPGPGNPPGKSKGKGKGKGHGNGNGNGHGNGNGNGNGNGDGQGNGNGNS